MSQNMRDQPRFTCFVCGSYTGYGDWNELDVYECDKCYRHRNRGRQRTDDSPLSAGTGRVGERSEPPARHRSQRL